jgi:hypothetical protein
MGKISPYTLGPKAVKADAQNVTIKIFDWEQAKFRFQSGHFDRERNFP